MSLACLSTTTLASARRQFEDALPQIEHAIRYHYLQARFTIRAAGVTRNLRGQPPPPDGEAADGHAGRAEEIVLDLRELAPWEEIADQVKALWDQGLRNEVIAQRLQCDRNQVTKTITNWHVQRGLEPPDGRSRWRQLGHADGHPIPESPDPPVDDPKR